MDRLKSIFEKENIEYFSPLPIDVCNVRRTDVIERAGLNPDEVRTVIMFLVPYYVRDDQIGNISLYARSCDYHYYMDDLFSRIIPELEKEFSVRFAGFADKSPIEETDAAAKAGLGVKGDNYLLINEEYGSYVFIGEIVTEGSPDLFGCEQNRKYEIRECMKCSRCKYACPMNKDNMPCLSFVTQQKGELPEEQKEYIRKYGSAWGCDLCQTACPLNTGVSETPIEFFRKDRIANLDIETLDAMSEEEFQRRAFSWRKRATIRRNLEILK